MNNRMKMQIPIAQGSQRFSYTVDVPSYIIGFEYYNSSKGRG